MKTWLFTLLCVGALVLPPQSCEVGLAEKNAPGDMGEITPEREAAALKFVELHHSELRDLLNSLRDADRKQFTRAIEDIFRVSERLARIKSRSPERYEIELDLWKANSRLNLLIASLPMAEKYDAAMKEIERAIAEKQNLQLRLLQSEERAAQQRLERVQKSIAEAKKSNKDDIARQLQRIRKSYPPAQRNEQAGP
ncbi:hypothetical protein [Rubinisphaera margarita]|uniref:hypothetical protein n=1 Tax=Rubinisphaera margarita TaxID=2909586 RepID=UPI001EE7FD55|nr:hypothetical protein [Rubinisphaera margarita]MCG6154672.1 hypothetical protein [Rubinisphaera margarita]